MPMTLSAATVLVTDYDAGIAFYCNSLGFMLTADEAQDDKRWIVVTPPGGDTGLVLAKPKNDAERAATGNQTGGRVAFFLETDDFSRDHSHMKKAGVTFLEEPRHEPYGTVAVFEDPFGNRWDLIERA